MILLSFDLRMSKVFKDMRKDIDIDDKDIMDMLFKEGIKSGEIGEA